MSVRLLPLLTTLVLTCIAPPARAQTAADPSPPPPAADTFLDAGAAQILERARSARERTDRSLRSYTAFVRSRLAADMRMPLKDRNLLRYEGAARVRWSRDGEHIVQLYGSRAQVPGKVLAATSPGPGLSEPFDPSVDRLYFGILQDTAREKDDFWIEHPLGARAESHYRYQSGDTLVIRLQDGHVVRVVELRALPRRDDPHTVRGVLWIDSESGALVRGAFRLARRMDILRDMGAVDDEDIEAASKIPLLNPMEFDLSLVTVDYSLWDLTHWLPRSMRLEGMARIGVLHFPFAWDVSYQMQDVATDRDGTTVPEDDLISRTLEAWRAAGGDSMRVRRQRSGSRNVHVITPGNKEELLTHELLPPPIWSSAAGFATESELREIYDRLARVPGAPQPRLPVRFGWGLTEPGMVRYNRVESLSIGARVTAPLPYATATGTLRMGVGDLHPNAELALRRESLRRTLELRAYHELTTVEPSRRALGAGNSLSAAFLGRDEGEYYRATGAAFTWAPPAHARRTWQFGAHAEQHWPVRRHTHVALPRLWSDSVFRDNITAWEMPVWGATFLLKPWWGRDPLGAQLGLDVLAQYERFDAPGTNQSFFLPGEDLVRARVTARAALPLAAGFRLGAEAGAGTVRTSLSSDSGERHIDNDSGTGSGLNGSGGFGNRRDDFNAVGGGASRSVSAGAGQPRQRLFYLGGAATLRGYEPGALVGRDMLRGRLELARTLTAVNVAAFTDYGRAGFGRGHTAGLWAAGVGASLIDGLVRIDLAYGFGGRRGTPAAHVRSGFRLDLHLDAVL